MYEPNFSLRPRRHEVSLDDDFEYTISPRFEALIDKPMTNLVEKIDLPISSLFDTPFKTSSPRDTIESCLDKT